MLKRTARRGVVMIFAVAILVLLSLMGATFASVSRIERTIARNYVDVVRARMLASAGVESAIARLSKDASDPARWGAWTCPEPDRPLDDLPSPSYALDRDGDRRLTDRDRIEIDGELRGVSALLAGTYVRDGDSAAVRVTEASARFPLDLDNPRMSAMIATLCRAADLPASVAAALERHHRSPSMAVLRERLLRERAVDAEGWQRVRALVTIGGFRDPHVAHPVPLEDRRRRGLSASEETYVYTWEEIRPNRIRLAPGGRPPVYLQEAPKPVLVALLAGLQGFYLDEESTARPIDDPYQMMELRYTYQGPDGSLGLLRLTRPITFEQASAIADQIVARRARRAFREWSDFERFVKEDLLARGLVDIQQADVLCTNANPNTCVNDFNTTHERFRWVDKTDLTAWSTEFALQPTGAFEIESIGRVLGVDHQTLAEARCAATVRVFEILRETSQRQFLREHWQDGAPLEAILGRERGAGATRGGLALTSFPELARPELLSATDWDGHLELATKRAEVGDARFSASFEDGIEPDTGQAVLRDLNGPFVGPLLADRESIVGKLFPDGVYSELDSVPMFDFQPASLDDFAASMWVKPHYFPEHAGRTRVYLTWQTSGNWRWDPAQKPIEICHGIYQVVTTGGEAQSEEGYTYRETWDTSSILAGGTIGYYATAAATPCVNHNGHGHAAIDRYGERWGTVLDSGKWVHIAWVHTARRLPPAYNNIPGYREETDMLYVNGQRVGQPYVIQKYDAHTPTTHPGEPMRLGERRGHMFQNTVPDATIDEVQVWNAIDLARADEKMTSLFRDGRYYAEDDATFRSAPFDPGRGRPVRLCWAAWTSLPTVEAPEAKIVLDVIDAGTGRSLLGGPSDAAGGLRIDRVTAGPMRYTARFFSGVPFGEPVVTSPSLDDVTIAWSAGTRILTWVWE